MASLLASGADHDPAARDTSVPAVPAVPLPGTPAAVAAVHAFVDATRLDALLRLLHRGTPPEEVLAARLGLPVAAVRAAATSVGALPVDGPGTGGHVTGGLVTGGQAPAGHVTGGQAPAGTAPAPPDAAGPPAGPTPGPAPVPAPGGRADSPVPTSPGPHAPGPAAGAAPAAPSHRPGIGVLGPAVAPGTVLVPVHVLGVDHRDAAAKAFAVVAPADLDRPDGVGGAARAAGLPLRAAPPSADTAAPSGASGAPVAPRPPHEPPPVPLARVVVLAEDWRLLEGDRRGARTVADALQRALDEAFAPATAPLRATATPVGAEMMAVHLTPLRPDLPVRVAPLLDNAGFALFAQPGAWRSGGPGDPGASTPVPPGADPSMAALAGAAAMVGAAGGGAVARPPGGVGNGARWVMPVVVAVVAAVLAGTVLGGVGPAALVLAAVAGAVATVLSRSGDR